VASPVPEAANSPTSEQTPPLETLANPPNSSGSPITSPSFSNDQYALPNDLRLLQCNLRLSSLEEERVRQIDLIKALSDKYGVERISKHQFEWARYATGPVKEEWLPFYTYRKGISIREIWEEWADGLDGHLSVRQLTEGWGARWRRNVQGQKTEASRRKHITELITKLSQKPNWTTALALRFLEDEYPIPGPGFRASATTFSKQLQNKASGAILLQEVMDKSTSYCQK
jgi:hypothetical protein